VARREKGDPSEAKADALFTDFPDVTLNWLKKAETP